MEVSAAMQSGSGAFVPVDVPGAVCLASCSNMDSNGAFVPVDMPCAVRLASCSNVDCNGISSNVFSLNMLPHNQSQV